MTDLRSERTRLVTSSRPLRIVASVIAVVIAIPLAVTVLDRAVVGPGQVHGPQSSSYSTDDTGLAAFAELLARYGHRVERVQGGGRLASTDPAATLVLLDAPDLSTDQAVELGRWVRGGGRLVTGGVDPVYLVRLLDRTPRWDPAGPIAWSVQDAGAARAARSGGFGSFDGESFGPEAEPVVTNGSRTLVARMPLGDGQVTVLADSSPLSNARLAQADNAALGLGLVDTNSVVFAENVAAEQTGDIGFAALPERWRFAAVGSLVAVLVLLWARRRLGPAEQAVRALAPPRAEHLEAVATMLEQAGDRAGAIAPLQHAVRRALQTRSATGEAEARAELLGMPADEFAAVHDAPQTDDDVLAAGRALARVHNWE